MAADLDWQADHMDTPCFLLVKTTTNFVDELTKVIGTSYDFLSDASTDIETMMNGNLVVLTTADITNEILNDSGLSQEVYVLLTADSALIISDQITCLLHGGDPNCTLRHTRIDPLMRQRMHYFLEATFEGQQDQGISNKVKYLMLLLSDVMFKHQPSAKSVVNDLSNVSKKELASVCKCIEEQLMSTGNGACDILVGKGEASDMFFTMLQPQQKSTDGRKVKRKRRGSISEQGDLAISIEPPTVIAEYYEANLDTGRKYKTEPVQVEKKRKSERPKKTQTLGIYNKLRRNTLMMGKFRESDVVQ
jgi:hypothetical protein